MSLDDALARAGELRDELGAVNPLGLADEQMPLLAQATDMTAAVINRIETIVAIDDELHPEER